jgi:hypothetical protein
VLGVTIKTTAETIYQANDRFGSFPAHRGDGRECPISLKADVQCWISERPGIANSVEKLGVG